MIGRDPATPDRTGLRAETPGRARPLFLALDGLDGTGKSTQCRLLADWLRTRGHQVVLAVDPGGTPLGQQLRELLLHQRSSMNLACEALLFMASRAQLTGEVIRPALDSGRTIVCDRFLLANVVYQGYGGGLDPVELWAVGRLATGGLLPDLTLVLDLPPQRAESRRSRPADRVEARDAAYHARVRQGFLTEATRQPERIQVVDADQRVEAVHAEICRIVESRDWRAEHGGRSA